MTMWLLVLACEAEAQLLLALSDALGLQLLPWQRDTLRYEIAAGWSVGSV